MPIGGAGDAQINVNAGMAAQPLATSADPNVVGPAAVENLVNSFRNGSITMNDILDRVDNAAKSKRKALMQEMGEYVSPDAIAARQAQRSAVTAQAQLQAQQAHAQSQLLPSESQFAQAKLSKEQADLLNKQAIDQYLQYNPPIYKTDKEGNPTKEVDFAAVADAGRVYTRAGTLQQIAAQGLTPVGPPQIQTDDKGIKRAVTRNALREDISPGSDAFEYYHGLRQQALSVLMKPAAKSQTSGQASSGLVQPAAPSPNAPFTPAPSVVMPTAGAPTYPSVAGTTAPGEQIAPEPGTEPQQVAETARKDTPVTDWKSSMGIIRQFHNTVERYKLPGPTPQNDTTLANTVMQLSLKSGGGGARAAAGEYKVTNIEDAVPLMERLYNIKATLTKEHAFPPEVRARLIAIGQDNISAIEGNAAEVLRDVPQTQLLSHERSLVARYPVEGSAAAPSAAAPAAAAGSAPAAAAALPAWSASVPGLKPGMVGGVPSWVAPDGRHWPQ
jgi:hypothetical protein